MKDIEYDFWIDYIYKIGTKHMARFDNVLDLCCGTGNSMIPMRKYAKKLYGVDHSIDMLKQAKKKGLNNLIAGDVRFLPLKGAFSFVYSIFDSLNYLIKEEDLFLAFEEVRKIFIPGGMFVFDLNSPEGVRYIARQKELIEENEEIYSVWRYSLNGDLITLYLTVFDKNNKGSIRIDEVHKERGYEIEMVRSFLVKSGFKPTVEYQCFSMRRANSRTKRVLYVARAI